MMNATKLHRLSSRVLSSVLAPLAAVGFVLFFAQHSMALAANVQTEPPPPLPASPAGGGPQTSAAGLSPHIIAIPSLDGTELYIQADQMPLATKVFFANVSVGPGHEKDAWSMTYTNTQEALTATALGFAPLESAYGSMNITGTVGGVLYSTNELEFNRAYLPVSDQMVVEWSPDGVVELRILPSALSNDTYLLMMSSFAPPGPARGSVLVSPSYSVRLADPIAQTATPVLMRMYLDGLPIPNADWHSLLIQRWDPHRRLWVEEQTHLSADNRYLWAQVDRLTEYVIAKIPGWLDEFDDLSGVEGGRSQSVELATVDGERGVVLTAGAPAGSVTSQPIKVVLPDAGSVTVSFSLAGAGAAGKVQVDLLDANGAVIAAAVRNGENIAIDPAAHSVLRLHAKLERVSGAASPVLQRWRLDQEPASRLYLPMMAR